MTYGCGEGQNLRKQNDQGGDLPQPESNAMRVRAFSGERVVISPLEFSNSGEKDLESQGIVKKGTDSRTV